MERQGPSNLPLETYLDGSFRIEDIAWSENMYITEGFVLVVSSLATDRSYVFESLAPNGNKAADGLLTILDDLDVVVDRMPASVNLRHPAELLGKLGYPFIEFIIEDENRKTQILPPAQYVEILYSIDLAAFARQLRSERDRQYQSFT